MLRRGGTGGAGRRPVLLGMEVEVEEEVVEVVEVVVERSGTGRVLLLGGWWV